MTEWTIFQARDGYWHFYPEDFEGRPEDFSPGHLTVEAAEDALWNWKDTLRVEEAQREADRFALRWQDVSGGGL